MTAAPTLTPALPRRWPEPRAALRLIKPVTWFPPMWAYLCGVVSAGGGAVAGDWRLAVLGVILAGPITCGMSQAANDWCDRHVDAINEPDRPIPSGRIPGRWGLWIALAMTVLSLAVGWTLGPWGFAATGVAVAAAWAYSAEPLRAKRSGIWGPGLVGLSYETLPWLTGAAIMAGGAPGWDVAIVAVLYGLGAHGLMTINDFKALEGDRQMGLRSLPVVLGPERAARVACVVMAVPQIAVIAALLVWDRPWHAAFVMAMLGIQVWAMRVWLTDPKGRAPWFNGAGIGPYVAGMMAAALALRGM